MDELFDDYYTTTAWTTRNQVEGLLVTSRAYPARSIFLPAAGYYGNTYLYHEGEWAMVWTRTLSDEWPTLARFLVGEDGDAWTSAADRWKGMPVRPVTKIE